MIPAKYWSPTKKLMVLGAMAGGKLVEDTATGNPLAFITDKAKPLKSLLIPFTPQQSGTGDPSPQNVRPIVPWEGLTVYHSGADTSNPTETDISFPSPVYGGTLDVVPGVLINGWGRVDLGSLTWEVRTNGNTSWFYSEYVENLKIISSTSIVASIKTDRYKTVAAVYIYNGSAGDNVIGQDGDVPRIRIRDDSFNKDVTAFTTAMSGVYLYFELATPTEQTLTGQQITALIGNNTIWSDADGSMTAVYLKKG